MKEAKQFEISQTVVREAFERVKANKGAAGVDRQSIEDFEADLERNLYKLWNRMSSGTYFPPAVRCVEIPKKGTGIRTLGVPTVADRVAQMVAKLYLEPTVEPIFHEDSYGYRPTKSALDAVGKTRERCMQRWWAIDLDIRAFFDSLDHQHLVEFLKRHTDNRWILLYTERWLKAPLQKEDGTLSPRDCGSPQGSVISPLYANVFLHHVFDRWMAEKFDTTKFERYADDIIVHCVTEKQAKYILHEIKQRFAEYKLELHPEKTKIVYCKTVNRPGSHEHESFDFLGYTFRPRGCKSANGQMFVGFVPAMSDAAGKEIRQTIRSWKLHQRSEKSLDEIARIINPKVQGWINYYGRFYRSEMVPTLARLNDYLVRWAMRKFKRFHRRPRQARDWLIDLAKAQPTLFAHWKIGVLP